MKIIADLHTHTLVSNHAFNTITEMAAAAQKRGLFAMAVTDHGPSMPDAPHPWYFYGLAELPSRMEDIWVLKGVEANVRDRKGTLDFTVAEMEQYLFEWLVVSIHPFTLQEKLTFDTATELWLHVAQNPYVDMIGHSESRDYMYDYDAVTKVFAQKNKVVEMNANSAVCRPGSEKNMRALALACMKNGTKIAVNSDAHSIYRMGDVASVLPMLEEIHFPQELVVNATKENLITELQLHHKKIVNIMRG